MSAACDRTLDMLADGAPLDEQARSHAAHCPSCAAMADDDSALEALLSATSEAPPMNDVLAAVAAQPVAPSRLRAPYVRVLAAIAPAVIVAVAVGTIALRRDFSSLSWTSRWVPVFLLGMLALAGISLAAARGRDGLGASQSARLAIAVATVLAFELLSILVGVQSLWGGSFAYHLACVRMGFALTFALVPVVLFALRRTDTVRPLMTGASVGASVAAMSAIIQHFECAAPSRVHTVFTHGFSFVSATLVGAWLGQRWLAP